MDLLLHPGSTMGAAQIFQKIDLLFPFTGNPMMPVMMTAGTAFLCVMVVMVVMF
jgi:hypothetical protein